MKRITPEMCLAAYEKTGAKPDPLTYAHESPLACCGIGVTLVSEGLSPVAENIGQVAYDRYGKFYCIGFGAGFSGKHKLPPDWLGEEGERGYADGIAAAEAVFRPTQTLGPAHDADDAS